MSHEQVLTSQEVIVPTLDQLSDVEFLQASREFNVMYRGWVTGEGVVPAEIEAAVQSLGLHSSEGLPDANRSASLINAYRQGYDQVMSDAGLPSAFSSEATPEELSHVDEVLPGPFGTTLFITDGNNEPLFAHDSLSFANADIMISQGLPPFAVVWKGYNETEGKQVRTHETSHMVWGILRHAGVIPSVEEGTFRPGYKSAFEVARDEAVAQMAAGQNKLAHPSVVKYMKEENYPQEAIDAYLETSAAFSQNTVRGTNLEFADGILAVASATSFEGMLANLQRLASLIEQPKE